MLSEEQKKIRTQIEAAQSKEQKNQLRKARNRKMVELHNEVEKEKRITLEKKLEDLERKTDMTRCFHAIKDITAKKKEPLIISDPETKGLISNEKDQNRIITEHFKKQFCIKAEPLPELPPKPMKIPFNKEEIKKAVNKLKLNKSPGEDCVKAELLKYAGDDLYEEIAKILNEVAKTGIYPKALTNGILTPLQKPGKPKGPTENLRPIILFSLLRKVLAICILDRTTDKINRKIPITQAAYRKGRSTTEQTFAVKTLAEWAITSKSEKIKLLMSDMSKAFDTINRNTLIEELKQVLDEDEIHLVKILLSVELAVRNGSSQSEYFETNVGAPQGDCLSAIQFTFYLANTLNQQNTIEHQIQEHNYHTRRPEPKPVELEDHKYTLAPRKEGIILEIQYADDISLATTDENVFKQTKANLPKVLTDRDLKVNVSKTEEYEIKRKGDEKWKQCKFLGTQLDTETEIKRRKGLTISALRNLNKILKSAQISIKLKSRTFDAYASSIFLFNSEIWTITKGDEDIIDAFQRRLLRTYVLNVKWPKKVRSEDIYILTGVSKWSKIIARKRLSWFGHLARLPDETPAKRAMNFALKPYLRPIGAPKTTWISIIKKQLKGLNFNLQEANELAQDRKLWQKLVMTKCAV